MMIVKSQHPNNHCAEPCCQTTIHTFGTLGFLWLWQNHFNGNSCQPIQQTLEKADLNCQVLKSLKKNDESCLDG
jgi:hypothetical protein